MEQEIDVAILAEVNDNDMEDLILVNILGEPENPEVMVEHAFAFETISEECLLNFRFFKDDIQRLVDLLQIPPEIRTPTRNRVRGLTAFCILLRRLAYPNRLKDLESFFGLSSSSLSGIINVMATFIVENWGHLLNNLQSHVWLNQDKLRSYAQAVTNQGGAIPNCWGFIDGTIRPIWRPSVDQQEYYSGHKRVHCVKYQSILCPDGIIVSLLGGYPGRRHDAGIFRDSLIYEQLEAKTVFQNENFAVYGDQAYGVRELLLCPFPGRQENLQQYQRQFNAAMSALRVSVEWGFQKIVAQFAFVDFKKNLKLLLQDVESLYKVAVILTNCHTCLYGSQTATFFEMEPPSINEYLGA